MKHEKLLSKTTTRTPGLHSSVRWHWHILRALLRDLSGESIMNILDKIERCSAPVFAVGFVIFFALASTAAMELAG